MQNTAEPISSDTDKVIHPIVKTIFDKKFWQDFAPQFTIENNKKSDPFLLPAEKKDTLYNKFITEGYLHLQQPGLTTPLQNTTALFTKIVTELNLPPVFAFMYDELWDVAIQLKDLVQTVMDDDYALLPAFWAWRVAPGQAGWGPHRDCPNGALFHDNRPRFLTVWVPITEAHPLNSCMYIVPANRDTMYGMDNPKGLSFQLADIRALPGQAGDVLTWTQHAMHWGGRSADEHDLPPRMSVAFEFQCGHLPARTNPLLAPDAIPSFEQRLALIAQQIKQYTHMYGFQPPLVNLAEAIHEKYGQPVTTYKSAK